MPGHLESDRTELRASGPAVSLYPCPQHAPMRLKCRTRYMHWVADDQRLVGATHNPQRSREACKDGKSSDIPTLPKIAIGGR